MIETKKRKSILLILIGILSALILTIIIALVSLRIRTVAICDDYYTVFEYDKYKTPVSVDGIEVIKQDVSCGYAVIEMFSARDGGNITEETLYKEYGKVVTSTGKSFCKEMNKRFPSYKTTIRKWLKNTELIDVLYDTLERGFPVPIEWAAKNGDEWTLHYSLVTGLDVPGNCVTVANPYGYVEKLTLSEFLDRTSFEAYEGMPLFLKLGFAFGIFEKNTVYEITTKK